MDSLGASGKGLMGLAKCGVAYTENVAFGGFGQIPYAFYESRP